MSAVSMPSMEFPHPGQIVVIDDVARTDQLDPRLIEAALRELLGKRSGLPSRHEHKQCVRVEIARALQEGGRNRDWRAGP